MFSCVWGLGVQIMRVNLKQFSVLSVVFSVCGVLLSACASGPAWLSKDTDTYVPPHLSEATITSVANQALAHGMSEQALQTSLAYYTRYYNALPNPRYLTVIDYAQHSKKERMYIMDMETASVETLLTTHGAESDPDFDGYATNFSNEIGSHQTSLGFYLTGEQYTGKYGLAMRLDGLQSSNSNARDRAIVLHSNTYVDPRFPVMGRSWGCAVISPQKIDSVVNRLSDGSLLLAYHPMLQMADLSSRLQSIRLAQLTIR